MKHYFTMRPKQCFLTLVMIVLYGPLFCQSISAPDEEITSTFHQIQVLEFPKYYKAIGIVGWNYFAITAQFFNTENTDVTSLKEQMTQGEVEPKPAEDTIDRDNRRKKVQRKTRGCFIWSGGKEVFMLPPPPPQQHHRN